MEDNNFEGEENQGNKNEKEDMFKIFDKEKKSEKKENDIDKKFEEKEKQEKENKIQELKENLTEKKPEEKDEEEENEEENAEESDHDKEKEKIKEEQKGEKKEEKTEGKTEENKSGEVNEKKEPEKKEEKKEEKPEEKKEVKEDKKISEYELINQDPSLKPYEWCIKRRNDHFKKTLHEIESNEKSLINFSQSYETMGVHVLPNGDIKYREYAPGCKGVSLFGEFNNWNKEEFWAIKNPFGCWELIIKSDNGKPRIKHKQKIKANVVLQDNNWVTRNPIWSHYLIQNKESFIFDSVFWNPEKKYEWKYPKVHL